METLAHMQGHVLGAGNVCKAAEAAPTCSTVSSGTATSAGAAAASPTATSGRFFAREWLYRMVMFPSYFTPCHGCCMGNRTPKREQLLTLFDTQCVTKVLCSHCPEAKHRMPWLVQIRRSAFKDVVKASDVARFGCDIGGIQQYTLNSSKVLYLCREPAPAGKAAPTASAPAVCAIDGRAMMDKGSVYCSLKCKMQGEDPEFTAWLDLQDPSVKAAALAAATAPPRPTAACKRGGPNGQPYPCEGATPASSGGSGGGGAGEDGAGEERPRKAPRVAATEAACPGAAGAVCAPLLALRRPAPVAVAPVAPQPFASHDGGVAAAFMEPPVASAGEWMAGGPLADLDHALSCTTEWGAEWAAPGEAAGGDAGWAAAAGGPGSEVGDWWAPLGAPEAPAGANAGAFRDAPVAASSPAGGVAGVTVAGDAEEEEDGAALLVEMGGAPLGSSCSELLRFGSAASPGSDADADGAFGWD